MVIFEESNMLLREILGIPVFVIIEGIAVTTGCGGGGLIVPTCMYLLSMTPKEASALSQALMFGAAFASLCIDWNRKEQNFNVPLIDVELLLFMGPTLMAGAMVGGLVNIASPDWFIVFMLIFVLAISGFKTLRKGWEKMKKKWADDETVRRATLTEKEAADLKKEATGDEFDEENEPAANAGDNVVLDTNETNLDDGKWDKQFNEIAPIINMNAWKTILALWALNLVILVVRGSKKNPSFVGMDAGSAGWWTLTFIAVFILVCFGLYFGNQLVMRSEAMDPDYKQYLIDRTYGTQSPKVWTFGELAMLSPAIFFAGIVSGTVGIGGGMILGPLMLMCEIPAQVVASVNTTSILLSASSLAALYLIDGAIDASYAGFYCFWTFVGAYVGKAKTKTYFAKNDFALVYIMAGVIISSWLLVFIKVVEEIDQIQDSGWDNFQSPT
jgi:uncharacterized membrane protein YfcA